jgi:alcohol dehydrogenase, propanol-preferring
MDATAPTSGGSGTPFREPGRVARPRRRRRIAGITCSHARSGDRGGHQSMHRPECSSLVVQYRRERPMRVMMFGGVGGLLREAEVAGPEPGPGQVRLNVQACAVCRTDLHIVDGELSEPKLPLVLGHQIVGLVSGVGNGARRLSIGERVGVPWLGWTDGTCRFCRSGRENLCDQARFTGYQIDGGFAEETVADERYCLRLPESYSDLQVAPLLCAGLIGYRSLAMTGDAERLGLYGFGASAHIIAQVARWQGRRVFAFTRAGDDERQEFALSLGAEWAGNSTEKPPEELDAAIIFAPVGELVPAALTAVAKGGVVVCAGIHMSDIPSFSYDLLWGERVLRSVANLTRQDGEEFMQLAPKVPVRTEIREFRLQEANEALQHLRAGELHGAAVLKIGTSIDL